MSFSRLVWPSSPPPPPYRHSASSSSPVKMTSSSSRGPHLPDGGAQGPGGLGAGLKCHMQPCPINTLWVQAVLSESSESQWDNSVYTGRSEAVGEGCPAVRALGLSLGPEGGGGRMMGIWRTPHPSSPVLTPYCPLKESQRCGGVNNESLSPSTHRHRKLSSGFFFPSEAWWHFYPFFKL